MKLTRFGAVVLCLLGLCALGVVFASGHLRWVAMGVGVFLLAMIVPGGVAGGVAARDPRLQRTTPTGRTSPPDPPDL